MAVRRDIYLNVFSYFRFTFGPNNQMFFSNKKTDNFAVILSIDHFIDKANNIDEQVTMLLEQLE